MYTLWLSLLLCTSVWYYWIFSCSCYVFDFIGFFAPRLTRRVLSSSLGAKSLLLLDSFVSSGCRGVSFYIVQKSLVISRGYTVTEIRSCWVDWTLRYQPFLDYVPGVLLYGQLVLGCLLLCCPYCSYSIWSSWQEVNLFVREKIQCFQWVRK